MQKIPFMLVLGDREMEQNKVAVRERYKGDIGVMSLEQFKTEAVELVKTRSIDNASFGSMGLNQITSPDSTLTNSGGEV
jgi:threonyl-tRNA synthetase